MRSYLKKKKKKHITVGIVLIYEKNVSSLNNIYEPLKL